MVFVMRRVESAGKPLGEQLRALRRSQAISLDMLERQTRVQRKYLEALEWGRYEELPEPLYTRNFIKSYVRFLQGDETYFIELYEEEVGRTDFLAPHRLPRLRVRRGRFFVNSKLMGIAAIVFGALRIVSYLGWQIHLLLQPPELVISRPSEDVTVQSALLIVEGAVNGNDVTVTVNEKPIALQEGGDFTTEVDLIRGLNIITIEAKRRYSRPATIFRRVIFTPRVEGEQ